jgi:hypothetical protein
MGYLDDKRKRAKQIIIDSLSEYDSAEEAIEDFHQFFLNSEWPDDECPGRPAAVETYEPLCQGLAARCPSVPPRLDIVGQLLPKMGTPICQMAIPVPP